MKKLIYIACICTTFLQAQELLAPLTGIVKPIYEGKIGISTEGKVDKVFLKEGDSVKKGQVILSLDSNLQRLETQRRNLLLKDKTQLDSLKKNLVVLEDILNKKEKLYNETKSISLNELNQLKMQYTNTKAELSSLIINEKKEYIEYQISKNVLDYYTLKSPVNGVITRIEPKIGEWVQVGKEIVQIIDIDTCFVEVDLTTNDLQQLSVNSKVDVEISNGKETFIKEGTVSFISAMADSSSGLIRAKIDFDNKDKKAIPGLTANVILK
ncbi:efflux RND transporter periplasmic adaptor subunit [Arcobacter sp. YIC-464]|uniref:efflux RND transporter periplasmic adaptor subunit n=1 Tax=Arcobacter sp. YIC-464 TaxID=3376631 RepID=UPI003C23EF8E